MTAKVQKTARNYTKKTFGIDLASTNLGDQIRITQGKTFLYVEKTGPEMFSVILHTEQGSQKHWKNASQKDILDRVNWSSEVTTFDALRNVLISLESRNKLEA